MTDRWWTDGVRSARSLDLVSPVDPVQGVGTALLGYHGIVASALSPLVGRTLVDQRQLIALLNDVDLTPVRKAVATSVGEDLGDAADRYAELMVDDVHRRAVDGTRRLVTVLVAKGVPWPRAIERATAVAGVPVDRLGLYPTQMAAVSVDPTTLADRADRVLLGWVAKVAKAVPVTRVGKAEGRGRARPPQQRQQAEEFEEEDVNRDEKGRFAAQGQQAEQAEAQTKERDVRAQRRAQRQAANRRKVGIREARQQKGAEAIQSAAAQQVEAVQPQVASRTPQVASREAQVASRGGEMKVRTPAVAVRAQQAAVREAEAKARPKVDDSLSFKPLNHAPSGLFTIMGRATWDTFDIADKQGLDVANGITFTEPLVSVTAFFDPGEDAPSAYAKEMAERGWRMVGRQRYFEGDSTDFQTVQMVRLADHYQGVTDKRISRAGALAARADAKHATVRTYQPGVPVTFTSRGSDDPIAHYQHYTNWIPHRELGSAVYEVTPAKESKDVLVKGPWRQGPGGVEQSAMPLTFETFSPSWTTKKSASLDDVDKARGRQRPQRARQKQEEEFDEEDVNRDSRGRFAAQSEPQEAQQADAAAKEKQERADRRAKRIARNKRSTAARDRAAQQKTTSREAAGTAAAREATTQSRAGTVQSREAQTASRGGQVAGRAASAATRTGAVARRGAAEEPGGSMFPMPQVTNFHDVVTRPEDSAFARHVGLAGSQSSLGFADMTSGSWSGDYTGTDITARLFNGKQADLSDLFSEMWGSALDEGQGDPYLTTAAFITGIHSAFPAVGNVWPTGEVSRGLGLSLIADDPMAGVSPDSDFEDMEIASAGDGGDDAAIVMSREGEGGSQFRLQQTTDAVGEEGESLESVPIVLSKDVVDLIQTLEIIHKAVENSDAISQNEEETLIAAYIDSGAEVESHTYYSTSRLGGAENVTAVTRLPQELWNEDNLIRLMTDILSSTDAVITPPSHDAMAEVGAFTMEAKGTDRVRLDNRRFMVIASPNVDRWPSSH